MPHTGQQNTGTSERCSTQEGKGLLYVTAKQLLFNLGGMQRSKGAVIKDIGTA